MESNFKNQNEIQDYIETFSCNIKNCVEKARAIEVDDLNFLIKKGNLPAKYVNLWLEDFKNFIEADNFQAVSDWIYSFCQMFSDGMGIFLSGSVGTGKSSLATIILKHCFAYIKNKNIWEWMKEKNQSFYVHVPVYFWQSSSILGEFYNESEKFRKKANVPVLAIDDVSKVEGDRYIEALDYIIRKRELNSLPTIITSQRPMEAVEDCFGTPIADLIQGNFIELQIVSESRRGK